MTIPIECRELPRRQLRYRLYRIQIQNPVDEEDGIREFFETQLEFDGWHNFAVTWDVGKEGTFPEGHWIAVKRKKSMLQEWEEVVSKHVQEFPVDTIYEENNWKEDDH